MTNIDRFKVWFKDNEQRWRVRNEQAIIKVGNGKAVIEINGQSYLASITVWELGSCDIIALGTFSEKEIWVERYDFQDFKELARTLETFSNFLSAYNPPNQTQDSAPRLARRGQAK